ncbi:hypothetical protein RGQ29_020701 [Quercus rubra]|uniref:Uncharacterized protein n=1 Tax=Quercus rubra TaxID=3512 RepID=A0AAN7FBH4_QUERU|nr:hypothetical protein RGQ29_020701 [Quercus rubra]
MVAFRNLDPLYLNSFLCHIITSILSRSWGPL